MKGNPQDPRVILTTTTTPSTRAGAPALRALGSPWTGWGSGILVLVALGFACVDRLPWGLTLVPLLALAAYLARRAVAEWPRVGFPACVLGVASFSLAAGLFRAGIGWSNEWDALRNAGAAAHGAAGSPVLGMGLAVLLGGSFLAVLFLHGETVWRNLSSVRLAVVTLSAIGTLSVIGTMVVQRTGAGSLPGSEKAFVEKFLQGQGAMPVSARFMVSPPPAVLDAGEQESLRLTEAAFGIGKARQMKMGLEEMHFKGAKAQAVEEHVRERREHLLSLFERLEWLGFTDVFHTWWFNSLFLLLAVQVVAVLSRRTPWGWGQAGWVLTHVGVIVTLLGAVLSDGFMKDGSLLLSPGDSSEKFKEVTRRDARGEPADSELGYRVMMLGTDQTNYHELQIAFPGVKAGGDIVWTREQLRTGRVFPLTDPETRTAYEVRILEAHERSRIVRGVVSAKAAGREGGSPTLRVEFLRADPEHGGPPSVLESGILTTQENPDDLVTYAVAGSEAQVRDLLAGRRAPGQGTYGTLRITLPGASEPLVVPATLGASGGAAAADGTGWEAQVLRYDPAFRSETAFQSGEGPAMQPVLEVEVRRTAAGGGAAESGRMLVFANPDNQKMMEQMVAAPDPHGGEASPKAPRRYGGGPVPECRFHFDFDVPRWARIVEGPGGVRTLAVPRADGDPTPVDFSRPGATADLGRNGVSVRLVEAIPDGVAENRIEGLPEETDAEYLGSCLEALRTGQPPEPTTATARIEVKEKDAKGERIRTEWLVAGKPGLFQEQMFRSGDGRLLVALADTRSAMMFRSALEVQTLDGRPIEVDGVPMRHVVRVNHALHWGGYAFYQNSFNPPEGRQPAYSVFRVKYDRGIPTIYTGFAILTLGVCIMLYFNPILRRKPRGTAAAGAAGEAARV